jgi:hypothetical protein
MSKYFEISCDGAVRAKNGLIVSMDTLPANEATLSILDKIYELGKIQGQQNSLDLVKGALMDAQKDKPHE